MADVPESTDNAALTKPPPIRKSRWFNRQRRMQYAIFSVLLVVCVLPFFPVYSATCARGVQIEALTHAKQIALFMKVYASDHDGAFPPVAANANAAYMPLIKEGYFPDEMYFSIQARGNPGGTVGRMI